MPELRCASTESVAAFKAPFQRGFLLVGWIGIMDNLASGCLITTLVLAGTLSVQAFESGFNEFEPDVPQVLTPVRLQQPQVEVPASVTVITAEQIRLWGMKDIAAVLRMVPGMFVSTSLYTNSSNVVYHSGASSLARRLEVLVDGRSVYQAAFATVDWQRLNIALEDIERIEITRGPSAASYGLNAFQGVIHIITRHPADSADAAVVAAYGSQQRRHGYASLTLNSAQQWYNRVSVFADREGEFGGFHADSGRVGGLPDLSQVKGINWSSVLNVDDRHEFSWQLSRQQIQGESLGDSNYQVSSPRTVNTNDVAWGRWDFSASADHQLRLQAYWQNDEREETFRTCSPTFGFDPQLGVLHRENRDLAEGLAYGILPLLDDQVSTTNKQQIVQVYQLLAAGQLTPETLQGAIEAAGGNKIATVTQSQFDRAQQMVARLVASNALTEISCGNGWVDVDQQRTDIELQDTVRWNEHWRSVQGISYRRDEVDSETYFGRRLTAEQWMAFINSEYRSGPAWLWSASLQYTHEKDNGSSYSPRLALNYLLSTEQSVRLQYAKSHRSPDLAERYLDATSAVDNISQPNYLDITSGRLFLRASAEGWSDNLKNEEVDAWEFGYFANLSRYRLQWDIKIFREQLKRLLSSQVSLANTDLRNSGNAVNKGIEAQLHWRPVSGHALWLTFLNQRRNADNEKELYVGADQSVRFIWSHNGALSESSLGFILDEDSDARKDPEFRLRNQILLARLGWKTGWGDWSVTSEYDLLSENLRTERDPKWLVWGEYRFNW